MASKISNDAPFDIVCRDAAKLADQGIVVYQKFTCGGCGARLMMEEPGHFYEEGTCDRCSFVTNIKKQGCGYAARMMLGIDASKQGDQNADQQSERHDHD